MQRLFIGTASLIIFATTMNSVVASTETKSTLTKSSLNSTLLIAQSIANGNFVDVEHPTQGTVSIVQDGNKRYLELSSDFKSDRGPDLKVILHRAEVVDLNIEEGSYISLGELQEFSGNQRYEIPENVDLSEYNSVAIWCEQFNAIFGYAPLSK